MIAKPSEMILMVKKRWRKFAKKNMHCKILFPIYKYKLVFLGNQFQNVNVPRWITPILILCFPFSLTQIFVETKKGAISQNMVRLLLKYDHQLLLQ